MGGGRKSQYLSKGIGQCHGKEEVCVGTPGVDPEVPEDRTEGGGEEEHHQCHQSIAQVCMYGRREGESGIKVQYLGV